MGAGNRVAKNTLILYARMGLTMFISLYSTRLILDALGASDFGIFNVVGGAVVMLTFLNNAMAAATQRFMNYAQGEGNDLKQKQIFNVSVIMHVMIGFILIILMEVVGLFLFNGILRIDSERIEVAKLIFHFLVISTFVKVISVPYDAVINAHENMLFVAILGILEALLKLSIALYITYTGFDKLASYGLLMASLAVLLLLIQRFYCHRKYEEVTIKLRTYFNKPLYKEMIAFGGWSLLGSTSGLLSNYGQGIVINMFFGTIVNAAQGVANQISGQLGAFSSTMLKALRPVIAKSEGAGNRKLMQQASVSGSKFSYFLLAFFAIPIFIEMPYVLNAWLKDVPEYAILFCRLLLIINMVEQMFVSIPTSIFAAGNIKNYQKVVSILAFVPLVVSYILFSYGFPPYFLYYVFIGHRLVRNFGPILYFAKKVSGISIQFLMKELVLRCLLVTVIVVLFSIVPSVLAAESFVRFGMTLIVSVLSMLLAVKYIGLSRLEGIQIGAIFDGFMDKIKNLKR